MQSAGGLRPRGVRGGDLDIQLAQAHVGIRQRFQFGGQRIALRLQLIGRDAMLAGEVLDADQLAFEAGQCVGVEVQIIKDGAFTYYGEISDPAIITPPDK